ncbi:adenylate/guanylate cyclase domain-containing protein [Mycobacterium nebraskense]|uniref:Guanylate cyclase n=2 Tax=Mycobacterium nebraskense TaxID=244292 RepID=A0A1X1Z4A2_9MYCO|nr:adenylate/guanylate cyclase domain-containing protein [Mycobacterium nebraskense]KLO38758.1 guanylate cyclase [Mycobacterium nebraskense]MBI2693406.1 adenylate/guanylate cyclase domain-containing protein [Mycobacterium nebraskense]MCV7119044.1 adenylate/guanylate cyclase domain-containing protein [Mycobacterium nebraskense]ORW18207.1 guanylate cyclase [Mycobacterium nebraskense]
MEPARRDSDSAEPDEPTVTPSDPPRRSSVSVHNATQWLHGRNHSPGAVAFIRRARRLLPGDPEFGDPLSTAGEGGPRAAARAADRLLGDRDAVSREVSLGLLQVWQALTESVARRPANPEVTLVFTDLVGFSSWSLQAGDEAALTLLRQVARAVEPPLLDAGGHIVKRMGDGLMAVFGDPTVAVRAVLAAKEALKSVEVAGYTPRMRVGIHTGRPQRMAADWLGVDVNIAARVMERATKGGIMVSGSTLDLITQSELDAMGVVAKRARKPVFAGKTTGVPADLAIYRLRTHRELTAPDDASETN